MLVNLKSQSANTIRAIRLTVGLTFCIAIAFGFNWPLSFIAPVFTAKFLGTKKPKMPFKVLVAILLVGVVAFCSGILITSMFLPYPGVFILITTLLIFLVSYWSHSGGNEFVITMLLIGFTLVPMLALVHVEVANVVVTGFLFSFFIALLTTMLMHEVIPDNAGDVDGQQPAELKAELKPELKPVETRFQLAVLSTIIIMPVLVFFLYFGLTSSLLILIFVAILAQKPDLLVGLKGSKALLVGNSLGGLFAIIAYSLLVIVPDFVFLILLFASINIYFAKLTFSERPLAPIYAMAHSTIIILIAAGSLSDGGAGEKFYIRILQIAAACAYIIFTTYLATPFLKRIENSNL
ncbi:DUF2955 domain-containing protein [Thalassotalea sp. ND16A]|uniref:DUF2955 domain-containing protein n=1 Tax=Thalassotalea sp. ND16A TaxID=1535422 RepID=UPI00051A4AE2|nr:DUF2955 domain-containing protein [Thalassotalea sp. ND16A]KGK01139.1 hypothetical protein ND16A_3001 [Thalassotalea sp. ND16A]